MAMVDRWDWAGVLKRVAVEFGWTPAETWDCTPHELIAVLAANRGVAGGNTVSSDEKLDAVRKFNLNRAEKGLRPICPTWMMPGLRRGKTNG